MGNRSKKSADIEIYHEASDPIPTKITAKTNEMFAPVGCYVENLGKENMGDPFYQVNQSSRSVLKRWIDDTTFEIIPGFKYGVFGVTPTEEVDYSNYKFKFMQNKDNHLKKYLYKIYFYQFYLFLITDLIGVLLILIFLIVI